MAKLVFLRHFSVDKDPNTPVSDWQLDEAGQAHMKMMIQSGFLSGFTIIMSSPENKALVTAEAICEMNSCEIKVMPELGEIDRTKVGYLSDEDYKNAVKGYLEKSPDFNLEWEKMDDVIKRIDAFVEEISHLDVDILVISHGMLLATLLHNYFGKPIHEFWKSLGFGELLQVDKEKFVDSWYSR